MQVICSEMFGWAQPIPLGPFSVSLSEMSVRISLFWPHSEGGKNKSDKKKGILSLICGVD